MMNKAKEINHWKTGKYRPFANFAFSMYFDFNKTCINQNMVSDWCRNKGCTNNFDTFCLLTVFGLKQFFFFIKIVFHQNWMERVLWKDLLKGSFESMEINCLRKIWKIYLNFKFSKISWFLDLGLEPDIWLQLFGHGISQTQPM